MGIANILIVLGVAAICQGSIPNKSTSLKGSDIQSRIIGGRQASIKQFIYQVLLEFDYDPSKGLCGGSLIHPKWVLTAAHCVLGKTSIQLLFGEIDRLEEGVKRNTSTFFTHPQFNSVTFNNDIAMVDLIEYVTLSDRIGLIALPKANAPDYVDAVCIASGWGCITPGGGFSRFLNYAQMRVITNSECAPFYDPGWVVHSTICTRGYEKDNQHVCRGDSGGPLAYFEEGAPTLVGVISFGSYIRPSQPAGYVRPQYFLDWINSYIEGLNG